MSEAWTLVDPLAQGEVPVQFLFQVLHNTPMPLGFRNGDNVMRMPTTAMLRRSGQLCIPVFMVPEDAGGHKKRTLKGSARAVSASVVVSGPGKGSYAALSTEEAAKAACARGRGTIVADTNARFP